MFVSTAEGMHDLPLLSAGATYSSFLAFPASKPMELTEQLQCGFNI